MLNSFEIVSSNSVTNFEIFVVSFETSVVSFVTQNVSPNIGLLGPVQWRIFQCVIHGVRDGVLEGVRDGVLEDVCPAFHEFIS